MRRGSGAGWLAARACWAHSNEQQVAEFVCDELFLIACRQSRLWQGAAARAWQREKANETRRRCAPLFRARARGGRVNAAAAVAPQQQRAQIIGWSRATTTTNTVGRQPCRWPRCARYVTWRRQQTCRLASSFLLLEPRPQSQPSRLWSRCNNAVSRFSSLAQSRRANGTSGKCRSLFANVLD